MLKHVLALGTSSYVKEQANNNPLMLQVGGLAQGEQPCPLNHCHCYRIIAKKVLRNIHAISYKKKKVFIIELL